MIHINTQNSFLFTLKFSYLNNFKFLKFAKDENWYAPAEVVKRPRIKK